MLLGDQGGEDDIDLLVALDQRFAQLAPCGEELLLHRVAVGRGDLHLVVAPS
jgi:hypothetical protein